jgi:predicted CoA-binding protein
MGEQETILKMLSMKSIAVVGLSDKPERASFIVASYLAAHGYKIIPINPAIPQWQGRKSYPSLEEAAREHEIEMVDVFRKSEEAPAIVQSAIAAGAAAVWLQEGVVNEEAAKEAHTAGLLFVMDKCIKKEHQDFFRSGAAAPL